MRAAHHNLQLRVEKTRMFDDLGSVFNVCADNQAAGGCDARIFKRSRTKNITVYCRISLSAQLANRFQIKINDRDLGAAFPSKDCERFVLWDRSRRGCSDWGSSFAVGF